MVQLSIYATMFLAGNKQRCLNLWMGFGRGWMLDMKDLQGVSWIDPVF